MSNEELKTIEEIKQYDGVESIPLMTQFCPNCGCRMDGGAY